MTWVKENARALMGLGVGLLALIVYLSWNSTPPVVSGTDSAALLEMRLARLRQTAATVPAKRRILLGAEDQLKTREKSVMNFVTAPQAQAHLLEVTRRLASGNRIDLRGSDFSAPKLISEDYGEVGVALTFDCTIDQFVNFLADLSKEPELIAPEDVRVASGNMKTKTLNVRMAVGGLVPKSLVPQKKGLTF